MHVLLFHWIMSHENMGHMRTVFILYVFIVVSLVSFQYLNKQSIVVTSNDMPKHSGKKTFISYCKQPLAQDTDTNGQIKDVLVCSRATAANIIMSSDTTLNMHNSR